MTGERGDSKPTAEGPGTGGLPQGLARFIDRFDRGEYWLAHEELEQLWLDDRRAAYKGLIHMAAALLHAERGNLAGARTKIASATEYLRSDADVVGFTSGGLVAMAEDLAAGLPEIADDGALAEWARCRRPLRSVCAAEVAEGIAPQERLPYRVTRYEDGYRPWANRDDDD